VHSNLVEWYRALISLRRLTPALRDGDYQACRVRYDEGARWFVVARDPVITACNVSNESRTVDLGQAFRPLLTSQHGVTVSGTHIVLPPETAVILERLA
jgi:maltooligosyltrehalose trehalohydrolase